MQMILICMQPYCHKSMNHKELTGEIARRLGYSDKDAAQLIGSMIAIMGEQLQEGKALSFTDFGTFKVEKKLEHITVNPLTKQRFLVPPQLILTFRPADALKGMSENTISAHE